MEGPVEKGTENPRNEPVMNQSEEEKGSEVEGQVQCEGPIEEPVEDQVNEEVDNLSENTEDEKAEEDAFQDKKEEPVIKHRKIIRSLMISLCALIVVYFGMAVFFTNRFCFGTSINGISVSGKTVEDVKTLMASELQEYVLNLRERGNRVEQIKASEVGLKYNSDEEFQKLKESQNPFAWIFELLGSRNSRMKAGVSYDEKLLRERIDGLGCFDSTNIIEPQNPSLQYTPNGYVIVDEIQGNKVDKETLYSRVADALSNYKGEINLESANCYIKPKFSSKSQEAAEARETLNKYVSTRITYNFGSRSEVLEGSTINKWLVVGENLEVTIDEARVKAYINGLSKIYDTTGITRNFVTSWGTTVQVSGGDFGRAINKSEETQNLIFAIKEGRDISKEPAYSQTVFAGGDGDIGNTYVEIDLTKQHIWFYKNGSMVVEGDIVSGNVSAGHTTPTGVYRLKYKARDAVLRGPGYAAPVDYWMPFNGGIGMHDASWRSRFGGTIYRTSGSHGCINCPLNVAKTIYNNIDAGTPVVLY